MIKAYIITEKGFQYNDNWFYQQADLDSAVKVYLVRETAYRELRRLTLEKILELAKPGEPNTGGYTRSPEFLNYRLEKDSSYVESPLSEKSASILRTAGVRLTSDRYMEDYSPEAYKRLYEILKSMPEDKLAAFAKTLTVEYYVLAETELDPETLGESA